jgi:integrase
VLQTVLQNKRKKQKEHIPYTFVRNGIYYFRYRVPLAIQQATNLPPIIRQSLKTTSPKQAENHARITVGFFLNLQEMIMARKRHDSLLLTQELISFASPIGDFKFEGNSLEEETNLVSKFVQENFETKDMVSNQSSAKKGLLISNMWAKWQGSWEELSDKETKGRIRYMDILIHLFGQQSICSITAKEADQVMKTVDMMPKSNIKPYSQWSQTERINAAVNRSIPKQERVTSSKHALKVYQGFYKWLKLEHVIDESPFNQMRYENKQGGKRGAFNITQVQRILDFSVKCEDPAKKWIPLLMAYSGMRNGEIQRLTKSDVRCCQVTNVWYILITDSKTIASSREVPIAQALLDLGFLSFRNSLDEGPIFSVSEKWLTRYYSGVLKRVCDLPSVALRGGALSVYSFRHTVTSLIRSAGANIAMTSAIMGHSAEGGIQANYTHTELFSLQELKGIVDEIPYRPKLSDNLQEVGS